jgi:D-3-phosphoglycerate dehydrogenase / 2-oxoglutarate reductase
MKTKWKVLLSVPYLLPVLDQYKPLFDSHGIELVIPRAKECLTEEELLKIMPDIDGTICVDDHFTRRVLEASPKLKVISKWGTGIDAIDLETAKELGIVVRNTPNAFTDAVADTTLGYMLDFARGLTALDKDMKAGAWKKRDAVALHEWTLGVIGVGNIGRAVIRRAKAFGMNIIGYDIEDISQEFIDETSMKIATKEQVLREGDVVSLHCTLNPTSVKMIGAKELAMMKPSAIIINTARGLLIDDAALVKALQSKTIAGAALDVFEFEPLAETSPLRSFDNALLAAHNANASVEARDRINKATINNCLEELAKHK